MSFTESIGRKNGGGLPLNWEINTQNMRGSSNINTTVADRISFPLDSGKAKSQGMEDKKSRMDTIKADISSGVYLNTDGNNIIQQAL
ncbi:hypothetical protein [Bacteroides fragilis]|uniref:hypothetical protein n=1 Tax=Bacteroides fragilis TaxID=817 RepID=UPI0018AC3A46